MVDFDDGFDVPPSSSHPIETPVPSDLREASGSLQLPSGEQRSVTPFLPCRREEAKKEAAAAASPLRGMSAPPETGHPQTSLIKPEVSPVGLGKTPGPSGGTPGPGKSPTPEVAPEPQSRLRSISAFQEGAASAQTADMLGQTVLLHLTPIRKRSELGEISARMGTTEQEVLEAEAEEKRRSISVLTRQGVPHDIAERLVEGYTSNWEGFVEMRGEECRQIHDITGLKVYKDPRSGKMVADYSLKTIISGGQKSVKSVLRLNNDGTISWMARYSRKKGRETPEEEEAFKERFAIDIQKELQSRETLLQTGDGKPVPNLLEIIPVHYVNKRGESKIRYMAQKCAGDAFSLIADRETLEPLPEGQKKTRRALLATRDCLVALAEMHKRGMVHKDIKPANIFVVRDDDENPGGLLGDLGFAALLDDPYERRCSIEYAAPEAFLSDADRNTTAMDMYGIGVTLFKITDPLWALNLHKYQVQAYQAAAFLQELPGESAPQGEAQTQEPPEDPVEEYHACVSYIQKELRGSDDELQHLIADLLNLKAEDRPTAEETLDVLSRYLQEHPEFPSES